MYSLRAAITNHLILNSCFLLSILLKLHVLFFITFNTVYICALVLISIKAKLLVNKRIISKTWYQDSVAWMRQNSISFPKQSRSDGSVPRAEPLQTLHHVFFFFLTFKFKTAQFSTSIKPPDKGKERRLR